MTEMPMKLKPWIAPNYAQAEMPPRPRQGGIRELPSFHVSELTQEGLDGLAAQWLADLYAKAGKPNNWANGTSQPPQGSTP